MKVLVCDRYTTESLEQLRISGSDAGHPVEVRRSDDLQPKADDLNWAEALLIRSRTKIDTRLLEKSPKLKIIITSTSGFDHIDLKACANASVKVSYTPEANAQSAAELTLFLCLAGLRQIGNLEKTKAKGLWKDQLGPGSELTLKTVGLIGFGRVARAFTNLLTGFGSRIIAHDPYVDEEVMGEYSVEKTNLTGVLKESDILSLHVPLTSETKNLMSKNNFLEMNSYALFINTSRGQVVNEKDLFEVLSQNQIGGAALDVFQHEPLPKDWPLRELKNLYWTPHIGAMTEEALARASAAATEKLIGFIKNGKIDDALPNSLPWLIKN